MKFVLAHFEIGDRTLLDDLLTNRREFVTRFHVTIVQAGYSKSRANDAHMSIIGAVPAHLMSTCRIGFQSSAST